MDIEGLYIQNTKGDLINILDLDKSDFETIYTFIKDVEELTNRINKDISKLPRCTNVKCIDNENGLYCTSNASIACHKRELLSCTNCECSHNLKGKYCNNTYQFMCENRKP